MLNELLSSPPKRISAVDKWPPIASGSHEALSEQLKRSLTFQQLYTLRSLKYLLVRQISNVFSAASGIETCGLFSDTPDHSKALLCILRLGNDQRVNSCNDAGVHSVSGFHHSTSHWIGRLISCDYQTAARQAALAFAERITGYAAVRDFPMGY